MSPHYRSGCACLTGAVALASVGSANAHSFTEGGAYDQFVQGMGIPWSAPASLLLLLSTGAMIGLWPGGGIGRMLPIMAAGALLGLLFCSLSPAPMNPDSISWLLLLSSVVIAGLAIVAHAWPWWLVGTATLVATSLCAGYSFMDHVQGEVPAMTLAGSLAGIVLCIVVVNNVITLTCERWPQMWVTIGFRVASSWLCAITIMMLAFTLQF